MFHGVDPSSNEFMLLQRGSFLSTRSGAAEISLAFAGIKAPKGRCMKSAAADFIKDK
jgi:hypothetical protein